MSHENALQWQEVTWAHGTKHGECGWIPKSEEEPVEDEIGDKGRGLTMQDAFGSVKKFHLYPKTKGIMGGTTAAWLDLLTTDLSLEKERYKGNLSTVWTMWRIKQWCNGFLIILDASLSW